MRRLVSYSLLVLALMIPLVAHAQTEREAQATAATTATAPAPPPTSREMPFDLVFSHLPFGSAQTITVQVWDAPTGGNLIFSEVHPNVKVGLFGEIDFVLGSLTTGGIPTSDFPSGASRYLDVLDVGAEEGSPGAAGGDSQAVFPPFLLFSAAGGLGGAGASVIISTGVVVPGAGGNGGGLSLSLPGINHIGSSGAPGTTSPGGAGFSTTFVGGAGADGYALSSYFPGTVTAIGRGGPGGSPAPGPGANLGGASGQPGYALLIW
jgi:hypothetical protein